MQNSAGISACGSETVSGSPLTAGAPAANAVSSEEARHDRTDLCRSRAILGSQNQCRYCGLGLAVTLPVLGLSDCFSLLSELCAVCIWEGILQSDAPLWCRLTLRQGCRRIWLEASPAHAAWLAGRPQPAWAAEIAGEISAQHSGDKLPYSGHPSHLLDRHRLGEEWARQDHKWWIRGRAFIAPRLGTQGPSSATDCGHFAAPQCPAQGGATHCLPDPLGHFP